jgi:hypothetical protein
MGLILAGPSRGSRPLTPAAPWQVLNAAIAPSAIYDGSTGITQSSGVTAWADALGAAPSLTSQGSGSNPSYTAGAVTVTQGQNVLETATATALFDTSVPISLALICAVGGVSGTNLCAISEAGGSGGYTRILGVQVGSGDYISIGPGLVNAGGAVAAGATVRLVIVSLGGGDLNIDNPNQARASNPASAAAAGSNFLTLGGYYIEASEVTATLYGVVVIPRVVVAGDITALKAYATSLGYTAA